MSDVEFQGGPDACDDYLMEQSWQEGFTCSLPAGHDGPHRAEGGINDVNIGADVTGRAYAWVFEWAYDEAPEPARRGPLGAPYERD